MQWTRADGDFVTGDRDRLDVSKVSWVTQRRELLGGGPIDTPSNEIDRAVFNVGLFQQHRAQVGFARWVTDDATFGWLCDVFIDSAVRGQGIGRFLIQKTV
ncbi:MAG TPA: GNAT family N-acetyltransferase [Acidimicrobiales bacterium]|nr:GNAT family N-acetyltransferase [Acidimicrobiales bacterium]